MTTLKTMIGSVAQRFQAWRERERAFAELSSLDDHTLADLGLRRSDIPLVVFAKASPTNLTGNATPAAANSNDGLRVA